MAIGVLTLQLQLPGCRSLKEKRSRLKPLIVRLHREFNLSVAEIDKQDLWDETTIGCAMISNDQQFTDSSLHTVIHWVNHNWPDVTLVDDQIEMIT
jgi:uncharacterized protein